MDVAAAHVPPPLDSPEQQAQSNKHNQQQRSHTPSWHMVQVDDD
jgi:hypothetical protein